MIDQELNEEEQLIQKVDQNKETIQVCCFEINISNYFKNYTLVCSLIMFIISVILFSNSFTETTIFRLVSLVVSLLFLFLYMVVYIHFKRTNSFGTSTSYFLAIFMITSNVLTVIFIIITIILIVGFNSSFLKDFLDMENKYILIWGCLIALTLLIFLFFDVLYFKSISKDRNRNEKKVLEKIESVNVN